MGGGGGHVACAAPGGVGGVAGGQGRSPAAGGAGSKVGPRQFAHAANENPTTAGLAVTLHVNGALQHDARVGRNATCPCLTAALLCTCCSYPSADVNHGMSPLDILRFSDVSLYLRDGISVRRVGVCCGTDPRDGQQAVAGGGGGTPKGAAMPGFGTASITREVAYVQCVLVVRLHVCLELLVRLCPWNAVRPHLLRPGRAWRCQ